MMTVGHGRLDRAGLGALLAGAEVSDVVDIRRFPGSRANPAASRGAIPELLEGLGIGYRWDERLGGRRALSAEQDRESPDTWWQVAAFRAYAAWTRSDPFRAALPGLVDAPETAALLCSEALWWRCHRRLVADVLVLELGVAVRHLMPDGRLVEHRPSAGARRGPDGWLVWDGATGPHTQIGRPEGRPI